jgi:hypothetical protein
MPSRLLQPQVINYAFREGGIELHQEDEASEAVLGDGFRGALAEVSQVPLPDRISRLIQLHQVTSVYTKLWGL